MHGWESSAARLQKLVVRHERLLVTYQAFFHLACAIIVLSRLQKKGLIPARRAGGCFVALSRLASEIFLSSLPADLPVEQAGLQAELFSNLLDG